MVSPSFAALFGQEVRRARKTQGLTQEQLADRVLGDPTRKGDVSKLENGHREPTAETVRRYADALGIPAATIAALRAQAHPSTVDAAQEPDVARIVAQNEALARQLGVQEGLLIALARRYAEAEAHDFDAALDGVERALEVSAEERERGRLPSNLDAAIDHVMAEVERLNDAGRIEEGERALVDALDASAREIEATEALLERGRAGRAALLRRTVSQAVLTANADLAARCAAERVEIEAGAPFPALRDERRAWYERGRVRGLSFDLRVAIRLARRCVEIAEGSEQMGTALNDLGIALASLGEREADPARPHEAVAAFREALKEFTRERVPLDWATTQNNLGNALASLGEREADPARLREVVAAYREALKEWTREAVPFDWALTTENVGLAYLSLFDLTGDAADLDRAEREVRTAREVFDEAEASFFIEKSNSILSDIAARRP